MRERSRFFADAGFGELASIGADVGATLAGALGAEVLGAAVEVTIGTGETVCSGSFGGGAGGDAGAKMVGPW